MKNKFTNNGTPTITNAVKKDHPSKIDGKALAKAGMITTPSELAHLMNLRSVFIKYTKNKLEIEKIGIAVKVRMINSFIPITTANKHRRSYLFSIFAKITDRSIVQDEV